MNDENVINSVRKWLEQAVIGMNLCPFANREYMNGRIRFSVTDAINEQQLLSSLKNEFELLNSDDSVETTLLIHPDVLQDFFDYNEFLDLADGLLIDMQLDGTYQVASFHPDYQFADTEYGDAENFTNRSPYPLLHIIREETLALAIATYPDVDDIPTRNVSLLKKQGKDKMQTLFQSYFDNDE